jgi:hypothetical protein
VDYVPAIIAGASGVLGALVGVVSTLLGQKWSRAEERRRDNLADERRRRDEQRLFLRSLYERAYDACTTWAESVYLHRYLPGADPEFAAELQRETFHARSDLRRTRAALELAPGAELVLAELNRVHLIDAQRHKYYSQRLRAGSPPGDDDPTWVQIDAAWIDARGQLLGQIRGSLQALGVPGMEASA